MEPVSTTQQTQDQSHVDKVSQLPPTNDIELGAMPTATKQSEPFLISFDEPFDAENPK